MLSLGRGMVIGTMLVSLLSFGAVFGGMYYVDEVGMEQIKKDIKGIEDRQLEIRDIQVVFLDGRVGTMNIVYVVKDQETEIDGYEMLFTNGLLEFSSQTSVDNVLDFQEQYGKWIKENSKRLGIPVGEFYVDRFVMWTP